MHIVEKRYQTEGVIITVIIHALLLALFYFMILSTPNPPLESRLGIGGGGVELNYGDDPNAGMGDNSNLLPIETASKDELNEQTPETPAEASTPTEVTEETTTPTELEDAVEIKATVSAEKKTEAKKNESTEKKSEQTIEKTKYAFSKNKNTSATSTSATGGMENDKEGNPGSKEGLSEKGKFTMGKQGSGGGTGGGHGTGNGPSFGDGYGNWKFIGNPIPVDNSNEFGKVQFILTVSEDGQIIKVDVGENNGISQSVLRIYQDHLRNLSLDAPNGVDIVPGTKIPVWYTIKSKN